MSSGPCVRRQKARIQVVEDTHEPDGSSSVNEACSLAFLPCGSIASGDVGGANGVHGGPAQAIRANFCPIGPRDLMHCKKRWSVPAFESSNGRPSHVTDRFHPRRALWQL